MTQISIRLGSSERTTFGMSGPASRLAAGALQWLRERLAAHRAAVELSALDDRALLDIGVHRSEIDSIAYLGRSDWTRYPR